jgi:hypothetical protein
MRGSRRITRQNKLDQNGQGETEAVCKNSFFGFQYFSRMARDKTVAAFRFSGKTVYQPLYLLRSGPHYKFISKDREAGPADLSHHGRFHCESLLWEAGHGIYRQSFKVY